MHKLLPQLDRKEFYSALKLQKILRLQNCGKGKTFGGKYFPNLCWPHNFYDPQTQRTYLLADVFRGGEGRASQGAGKLLQVFPREFSADQSEMCLFVFLEWIFC